MKSISLVSDQIFPLETTTWQCISNLWNESQQSSEKLRNIILESQIDISSFFGQFQTPNQALWDLLASCHFGREIERWKKGAMSISVCHGLDGEMRSRVSSSDRKLRPCVWEKPLESTLSDPKLETSDWHESSGWSWATSVARRSRFKLVFSTIFRSENWPPNARWIIGPYNPVADITTSEIKSAEMKG